MAMLGPVRSSGQRKGHNSTNSDGDKDNNGDANQSSIWGLDWEMTGLGSGTQDLGQYILPNMEPSERRGCGRQLIEAYCQEMMRLGV